MQPLAWKRRSDKSDKTESAASEKPSASTDEKKSSNKQPTVRRPPRQQTSERAKEMLSDADAARRVYERMQRKLVQDFANIQWFARPEGPVQCRNAESCGCNHSMFWCHTCGYGYCLTAADKSERHVVTTLVILAQKLMRPFCPSL